MCDRPPIYFTVIVANQPLTLHQKTETHCWFVCGSKLTQYFAGSSSSPVIVTDAVLLSHWWKPPLSLPQLLFFPTTEEQWQLFVLQRRWLRHFIRAVHCLTWTGGWQRVDTLLTMTDSCVSRGFLPIVDAGVWWQWVRWFCSSVNPWTQTSQLRLKSHYPLWKCYKQRIA